MWIGGAGPGRIGALAARQQWNDFLQRARLRHGWRVPGCKEMQLRAAERYAASVSFRRPPVERLAAAAKFAAQ
jgi:hypothetical protein